LEESVGLYCEAAVIIGVYGYTHYIDVIRFYDYMGHIGADEQKAKNL
jgi:hypothetical protein